MLSLLRGKFGPMFVGGIIGFIAFVFIFSGIFNPSRTKGLHSGSVAGEVNGEAISLSEFNRALNQRIEFYKQMTGGKISEDQIKQFGIRESVFNDLVNRKLMAQEAVKQGMLASDEEIRDKIREIPAFQKDGKFDPVAYRQVLQANNYTPAGFERMLKEDLNSSKWGEYFRNRVVVSDEEIKDEFLISREKRNIKYVVLTTETGKKGVTVSDDDVKKFLAEEAKANLVKSQYEQRKETQYKGKAFDEVKNQIARETIASQKTDEIQKFNANLAKQVQAAMKADKASDAKINAQLKPYGATVQYSGLAPRTSAFLPGVGEAKDVFADAFAKNSPIQAKGGAPKVYNAPGWTMVALVSESESPDLAKLESAREEVRNSLASRKERGLFESWMKKLNAKAKIRRNESIVGSEQPGQT